MQEGKSLWKKATHGVMLSLDMAKAAAQKDREKRGIARLKANYEKFGRKMGQVRDSNEFNGCITFCIILAGALVGIQRYVRCYVLYTVDPMRKHHRHEHSYSFRGNPPYAHCKSHHASPSCFLSPVLATPPCQTTKRWLPSISPSCRSLFWRSS